MKPRPVSRRVSLVWALVLFSAPGPASTQETARWADVPQVVVVADVHGAYPALVDLLAATGIVDGELAWAGGDSHLVSLGDLLDRGTESRRVLDLLMRLEKEAATAGGRVHVVLGNHELMNLIGDLRYVSTGEYAAFAADESDAMREQAFAALAAAGTPGAGTRAAFDAAYPRGYFAHREAFGLRGRYGAWLLMRPAIVVVNETAFVHGGLPALVGDKGLALNDTVQSVLRRYLELREQLAAAALLPPVVMERDRERAQEALRSIGPNDPAAAALPLLEEFVTLAEAPELGVEGPLWYRGSVYCKPLLEAPVLDAALARLDARRVVVGHTPTEGRRVAELHGGRVLVLDTGMLASYYSGRPAALVLENGSVVVQYADPDERVVLNVDPVEARSNDAYWLDALERGSVTGLERGARGDAWQVTLLHEGRSLRAAFYAADAGGDFELAAARLDDMLGTSLVPPTVVRMLEGIEGALQLRHPDAVSEAQRLERRLALAGWCPIEPQLQLVYVFDALTFNRGRSAENVLYANELSNVTLTDHGRAFGTERYLSSGLDPRALRIPPRLVASLRALDEAALEAAFGDRLDPRRIRALIARRDRLVAGREAP